MASINYLSTIDLGKINRWNNVKAASITPISFPGQDANLTEGVDSLGIIAYYNIGGRVVGDFSTLQNTIQDIRAILDGAQISSVALRSPFVNARYGASSIRRQGHIGTNTHIVPNELKDTSAFFQTWNIDATDKIKCLTTGNVYEIATVDSETELTLASGDPFTTTGMPYAVTAFIDVKVLSFDVTWNLPGLNAFDYTLSVMQVKS